MDGKPCGHGNGWTDGRTDGRIGQSGRQAAPQDRHPPAQSARVGDAAGRGAAMPKSQCLTPGHLAGAGTQWGRGASRVPRVSHGCPTGVPCSCAPQAWHRNGAHGAAWGPLWGGHAAASMGTLLRWTHGRYPPPPSWLQPCPTLSMWGGGRCGGPLRPPSQAPHLPSPRLGKARLGPGGAAAKPRTPPNPNPQPHTQCLPRVPTAPCPFAPSKEQCGQTSAPPHHHLPNPWGSHLQMKSLSEGWDAGGAPHLQAAVWGSPGCGEQLRTPLLQ